MLIPATIYLDDVKVGVSNVLGDYLILGVSRGQHKVTAQISLFPGTDRQTVDMVPGEEIKNFDLVIGSQ
jgi:hypothetical protein